MTAAVLGWVLATLPPRAARPDVPAPPPPAALVAGAYHIHSTRSDGSGTVDAIAAAAARAGLRFIILTDHGDATRTPDPPAYRHGVLCIDAVEVSSQGGHVVALNLRSAAPYPLAGETRDVVEDIHRLGGWAVAAHPDSPRPGLRWRGGAAAVDGIEWMNADSEWRGASSGTLLAAVARSWFRPAESVAALFGAGTAGLQHWDAATRARPTFTLAAVDAHARLGEDQDGARPPSSLALAFPGYETMFRAVAQTVRLPRGLSGEAATDAAAVLEAIGHGQSYSVIRGFMDAPGALAFDASSGTERVDLGGTIGAAGPVALHAAVPAGLGATLVLVRDGRDVQSGGAAIDVQAAEPGTYRVEVRLAGHRMPWIVSNAIRVGGEVAAVPAAPPASAQAPRNPVPGSVVAIPADSWVIESNATSTATIGLERGDLRLQYRLGGGPAAGQYVALATGASGSAAIERLEFTASSTRPMRVSVQIRLPGGVNGQRWRRSIYVDDTPRPFSVALSELEPVDRRTQMRPISARVQSVLLVIDTLNTLPGGTGEFVLKDFGFIPGRGGS